MNNIIYIVIILSAMLPARWRSSQYLSFRQVIASMSGVPTKPASGYRDRDSGGLANVGGNGNYWCAIPNSTANGRNLNFNSGNVYPQNANNRAYGFSVRPARAFKDRLFFIDLAVTYTYEQIYDLTADAYHEERKNIRNHYLPLKFEIRQEERIKNIARKLYKREYHTQPYGCFMLEDPTIREVFFPYVDDAIVSHILFGLVNPIFDRTFIYDNYSCRKGKGTLFGINRMEHFIRSCTDNYRYDAYALNIDISGFFMAINKGILYSIICDALEHYRHRPISLGSSITWDDIIDFSFVDYLVRLDLFNHPLDNCIRIGDQSLRAKIPANKLLANSLLGSGVPIGKVTNQLNSSIYLNVVDQYAKRVLKARYYGRYVDDSRIISRDICFLEECKHAIGEFLRDKLKLTMHPDKTCITSADEVNFLGAVLRPYRRYASNKTIKRFRECIMQCNEVVTTEDIDLHIVLCTINSYLGYLKHFNEKKIVKQVIRDTKLIDYFDFDPLYECATIKKSK